MSRPANGNNPLQRFTVTANREKWWVCSKPWGEGGHLQWHQIARCCQTGSFPNAFMAVGWDVKLQSGRLLVFERPFLVWTKVMNFTKDQFFRFA